MRYRPSLTRPFSHRITLVLLGLAIAFQADAAEQPTQIAFMPDIHFHDIYAQFEDGSFDGIENSISGKKATIRTMQAQLNSTRLFNENYFALLAALDDIAARGIRLVALPGDFSDDGQPVHIRGLRKILDRYRDRYGMQFFAAPGNHDPVRPFDTPGGEPDFLGRGGHAQRIFSRGAGECTDYEERWTTVDTGRALPTICSEEIRHLGYRGIMAEMQDFGFYPSPDYQYWETPYSDYESYDYDSALTQADYRHRQYEICRRGSGGPWKKPDYRNCHRVPDASYLVEPVPGLWLLSIDANVYVPEPAAGRFAGSGNAGYNRLLTHKRHLLDWIRDIVKRARRADKQLIAFSHFPMTEFYDDQSDAIASLFGSDHFQLQRRPQRQVSRVLAETGLRLHVGGHMHINDTGIARGRDGHSLFNIQAPSLAAYLPAYKILTLHSIDRVEVETVILDRVPGFDELFEHYRREYDTALRSGQPPWNPAILQSADYRTFTRWHIRELSRQRFLPREWPQDLRQLLLELDGRELLTLTRLADDTLADVTTGAGIEGIRRSPQWQDAQSRAREAATAADTALEDFSRWNGFDLAVDFYRLRNGGALALRDIGSGRLAQYRLLATSARQRPVKPVASADHPLAALFDGRLAELLGILEGLQRGAPDDHFMLDLADGEIRSLELPAE